MADWVRYRSTQEGVAACDAVRTVVIGDGVAVIPPEAFAACGNLESVTMADSVAEIGERAFYRDGALASVAWPAGLQRIGESAFQETGLVEVALPEAVEEIGLWAFDGMARLKRVVLPDRLTSVEYAFSRCPALQSVSLGGGLSRLGDYEFSDCTGLKELYLRGSGGVITVEAISNGLTVFFDRLMPATLSDVLEARLAGDGRAFCLRLSNEHGTRFTIDGGVELLLDAQRRVL